MSEKKGNKEKNSTIDNIIEKIADKVNKNPDKDRLKEHLGSFNVTLGVVEDTVGTYKVIDVLKYPTVEVYDNSAAAYSVRNKDLFRDYIFIEGKDGKKAKVEGEFGDKISLARRLKIVLNIIGDSNGKYIVKTRGLREKVPRYQKAMKALNEYTKIIKELKKVDGTVSLIGEEKVIYYQVLGKDVLKEIDEKEIKDLY